MASFPVSLQLFLAAYYVAGGWFTAADLPKNTKGFRLYCRTRGIVAFDRALDRYGKGLATQGQWNPVPAEPTLPPNEEFSEFER